MIAVTVLPPQTLASLVVMFAAYLATDGIFAFLAGFWVVNRENRSPLLIYEGAINLAVAGAVLAWQSVAIVPFFRLASVWAVITGAMLLAAAHRLVRPHGRPLLALAGAASALWGLVVAATGPSPESSPSIYGWWLVAYAVVFGSTLLALAVLLLKRHWEPLR